jgi:hypothetical protein
MKTLNHLMLCLLLLTMAIAAGLALESFTQPGGRPDAQLTAPPDAAGR